MILTIVTITSLALAAVMSAVAWRLAAEERRRSEARVALLAGDIHGQELGAHIPVPQSHSMFETVQPRSSEFRLPPALVAGGLAICVVAAAAAVAGHTTSGSRQAPPAAAARPLELIALSQEREADHLNVHGIIRNPAGAQAAPHLTAVVLLFNQAGAFITSGRAEVNGTTLEAGGEATFTVSIPGASEASRYRVSFRSDDRVIPHVDRREGTSS